MAYNDYMGYVTNPISNDIYGYGYGQPPMGPSGYDMTPQEELWNAPIYDNMQNIDNVEMLNNYANMYADIDPQLSGYFRNQSNLAGNWGRTQNNILNWYNQLANDVSARQQGVTDTSVNLANDLLGDINTQRDYVMGLYGPNGTISNQVNDYYSGLINSVAGDTGRQMAQNVVNAKDTGASASMIRATQNQIADEGYQRSLQAMAQDIDAKNKIAENLQNYLTALRQEYGNTTNEYIIKRYQEANDLLNQIESSMTETMNNMEMSKLQYDLQRAQAAAQSRQENVGGLTEEDIKKLESLADTYKQAIAEYVKNGGTVQDATKEIMGDLRAKIDGGDKILPGVNLTGFLNDIVTPYGFGYGTGGVFEIPKSETSGTGGTA